MSDSTAIPKKGSASDSMDYHKLLEKGLEQAQLLTHDNWTDFNQHDPGITILEQLCYTLTDLNYRTGFDIKDILSGSSDQETEDRYKISFYQASDILLNKPVTLVDFRKLLISSLPEIANAWLSPVKAKNTNGIKGFYEVKLMPYANSRINLDLIDKASQVLNSNRSMCECFADVEVLEPVTIIPAAKIHLTDHADPVQVMAQIYYSIETYFSPPIGFYSYQGLIDEGYTTEEIMVGPLLLNGFIKDEELFPKPETIYASDAIKKILSIEDVALVENFSFQEAKGDPSSMIKIDPDSFPVLNEQLSPSSDQADFIQLFQKNLPIGKLDQQQVEHAISELRNARPNNYRLNLTQPEVGPSIPLGEDKKLSEYDSIQNGFPSYYLLGEGALNERIEKSRKAQVMQLKGYLMFFDQLMTNYLAQLSEVWKLLSFEAKDRYSDLPEATYYFSELYDVPNIGPVMAGYQDYIFENFNFDPTLSDTNQWRAFKENPENEYRQGLIDITSKTLNDLQRKRQFLDHLMARTGYEGNILDTPMFDDYVGQSFNALSNRGRFLKRIPSLSMQRGSSYDHQKWAIEDNIPIDNNAGISDNLNYMLDLDNFINDIIRMEFDCEVLQYQAEGGLLDHINIQFKDASGKSAYAFSLSGIAVDKERVEPLLEQLIKELQELGEKDQQQLNDLVSFGTVTPDKSSTRLYISLNKVNLITVFLEEVDVAENVVKLVEDFLSQLSYLHVNGQGMIVLEHILLAPPNDDGNFKFWIKTQDGRVVMRSVDQHGLQQIDQLIDQMMSGDVTTQIGTKTKSEYVIVMLLEKKAVALSGVYKSLEDAKAVKKAIDIDMSDLHSGNLNPKKVFFPYRPTTAGEKTQNIDASFFSMKYTLIMPNWTPNYNTTNFRNYFEYMACENSPAHLTPQFLWLDKELFDQFYQIHQRWIRLRASSGNYDISAPLVNFLNS